MHGTLMIMLNRPLCGQIPARSIVLISWKLLKQKLPDLMTNWGNWASTSIVWSHCSSGGTISDHSCCVKLTPNWRSRKCRHDFCTYQMLFIVSSYAHDTYTNFLEKHNFEVTKHFQLETAWKATFSRGSGGRTVGLNSEASIFWTLRLSWSNRTSN